MADAIVLATQLRIITENEFWNQAESKPNWNQPETRNLRPRRHDVFVIPGNESVLIGLESDPLADEEWRRACWNTYIQSGRVPSDRRRLSRRD